MSTYGLWLSAAGMKVNEYRQSVMTNNLANANTPGFKRDLAIVRERPVESHESPSSMPFRHPVLSALGGGLNVRPQDFSEDQGALDWTGRPLDVAIEGEGYFEVSAGDDVKYTRNGSFGLSGEGDLIVSTADGRWHVRDDRGETVRIDPQLGEVRITEGGVVRQADTVIAQLAAYKPEEGGELEKFGETLFNLKSGKMELSNANLRSEYVERSNIDVMSGLASMIEVSRAYEINANLIRLQDETMGRAVSTLGRLSA